MALPRVFISTDLRLSAEEKDDAQSLIHALLYQDKMDIVGIAGTASKYSQDGLVGDIDKIIDVYAEDYATLEAHSSAFKSPSELKAVSWQGATDTAPAKGYSTPTASSKAIIAEAHKAAAAGEVLNVLTWGGETDLAQALHDDPSIAPHIRFFNINTQDDAAYAYIKANFQGEFDMWVDDRSTWKGIYQSPESSKIIPDWHEEHAEGHGALGDLFADLSQSVFHQEGVKMGDSPTVLRFLSGNQDDPTKESWGGEFVHMGDGYYTDSKDPSLDFNRPGTNGTMTIYEDRDEWLDDFEERLDWLKEDAPSQPKPPAPQPPSGTGEDTLTVKVSGSAFNGDPNFALTLNGKVIDATNLVTADHKDGEWQTFTFKGDFVTAGVTSYKVGVQLTNDKYAAGVGDRNLWVDEVALNGVVNTKDAYIPKNSTTTWDLAGVKPATAPAPGTDTVSVRVSGDAWEGDPRFALTVNGETVSASTAVTADRSAGQWQTLTFTGDFDLDGTDRVGIRFTNDHWEGSGKDRNLYVDEVRLNGETNGTDHDFFRAGTAQWDF